MLDRSGRSASAPVYCRHAPGGRGSAFRWSRGSSVTGERVAGKVLVVDDDASVQRLLQFTLQQEGYEVVMASDGADGLRRWQQDSPSLDPARRHGPGDRRLRGRDPDPRRGGRPAATSRSSCSPPTRTCRARCGRCAPVPTTT